MLFDFLFSSMSDYPGNVEGEERKIVMCDPHH